MQRLTFVKLKKNLLNCFFLGGGGGGVADLGLFTDVSILAIRKINIKTVNQKHSCFICVCEYTRIQLLSSITCLAL